MTEANYKQPKYWQSVLRFGIPWIIVYRGIDYLCFRIANRNSGIRYDWWLLIIIDIPLIFVAPALWRLFTRVGASPGRTG
jgi:hypothetical protein